MGVKRTDTHRRKDETNNFDLCIIYTVVHEVNIKIIHLTGKSSDNASG